MVLLFPPYIGGYEHCLNCLPNIARSLELVEPEFDPGLFAKSSSLFVLCSPFFCRNNQKIYSSCLRGLFNKKGWLANQSLLMFLSFLVLYSFWHLSQNLLVVRESLERVSLNRQLVLRLGWERLLDFMVNFDWENVTYFKGNRSPWFLSGGMSSKSCRVKSLSWGGEVNKNIDMVFRSRKAQCPSAKHMHAD